MADRTRRLVLAAVLGLAAAQPAQAQRQYLLDQRFGSIAFSVGHLGLFSSTGEFRRFRARLVLDPAHPERTRIAVDVQAGSVAMAWQPAADMLRSDAFLDVQRFPDVRFNSTSVTQPSADRFVIQGVIRLRGVARPVVLAARLVRRHAEWADFVVTGSLERSDFGMTADPGIISDRVDLRITARLQIAGQSGAG